VLGLEIELKMSSPYDSSGQNLLERREAAACLFFLKQLLQKIPDYIELLTVFLIRTD